MSNGDDKIKNSKRRQKDENAINKQLKIAKQFNTDQKYIDQPHRLSKHHVLNCGNPKCMLCSNPRHNKSTKDRLTIQEKREFQDMDNSSNKKNNGSKKGEE